VTGHLAWNQGQQNCGTGAGVKFPCSWVGTARPIRQVTLKVLRYSDNKLLGDGLTDNNGDFAIAWADSGASGNVAAKVIFYPIYYSNTRFKITPSDGSHYTFIVDSSFTATNGGVTNLGNRTWGTSEVLDVYDGANMTWRNTLGQSTRMQDYFGLWKPSGYNATTFVQIRLHVDDGTCTSAAAYADKNRICIPSGAESANQARVMHEMGHIAEAVASPDHDIGEIGSYLRDGVDGWSATSQEHHSVQFSEAFATMVADTALYYPSADQPRTGLNTIGPTTTSLEDSSMNCSILGRSELAAERFFWDAYDTDVGGDGCESDIYWFIDAVTRFAKAAQQNKIAI
jgi:hypothetical protein